MKPISDPSQWLRGAALTVWLLSSGAGQAQSYTIERSVLGGGGGTSSNGQFSVTGTIGQPEATTTALSGGSFLLTGGFWSMPIVIQTPGAPTLRVMRLGGNVVVSWDLPADGFILEVTDQFGQSTTNWQPLGATPVSADNQSSVTLPLQPGTRYYRLKRIVP